MRVLGDEREEQVGGGGAVFGRYPGVWEVVHPHKLCSAAVGAVFFPVRLLVNFDICVSGACGKHLACWAHTGPSTLSTSIYK